MFYVLCFRPAAGKMLLRQLQFSTPNLAPIDDPQGKAFSIRKQSEVPRMRDCLCDCTRSCEARRQSPETIHLQPLRESLQRIQNAEVARGNTLETFGGATESSMPIRWLRHEIYYQTSSEQPLRVKAPEGHQLHMFCLGLP